MKHLIPILFVLMTSSIMLHAQRVKKISGNPNELSGETKLHVVFEYDDMRVGKFAKESDYIKSKKEEYNKKEEGRGEKWEEAWNADRQARFEPQFTELFEKHSPFAIGNYADAKYTMIIRTTRTEPGYNIYISRKNAEIDLEIEIIETASKRSVAKYSVKNSPGRTFGGYDYDSGTRIQEAYAAAGKYFGKELKGDIK